jgi:Glycosyl-4,4'-diaponeurosporenoate acyltransferase
MWKAAFIHSVILERFTQHFASSWVLARILQRKNEMKHLILGIVFGISMSFISWMVGMILNSFLVKTKYYDNLSNLNFVTNKALQGGLGIKYFRWIVKNSLFKFFNQKIRLENKSDDLVELRKEMTIAEVSHLIGFAFVAVFAIYKCFTVGIVFGLTIMIPNIFMNLYPSLLQQENKRRIDGLLHRKKRL